MLHTKNTKPAQGFRTLSPSELDAVSGGQVLHIDGDAAKKPELEGVMPGGFDLADVTGIAGGGNVLVLTLPSPESDGSEYRVPSSNSSPDNGADPDPSSVDPNNPLSGSPSSPPSLNPSQGQISGPDVKIGNGSSANGFIIGKPPGTSGGGVTITVPTS